MSDTDNLPTVASPEHDSAWDSPPDEQERIVCIRGSDDPDRVFYPANAGNKTKAWIRTDVVRDVEQWR